MKDVLFFHFYLNFKNFICLTDNLSNNKIFKKLKNLNIFKKKILKIIINVLKFL